MVLNRLVGKHSYLLISFYSLAIFRGAILRYGLLRNEAQDARDDRLAHDSTAQVAHKAGGKGMERVLVQMLQGLDAPEIRIHC